MISYNHVGNELGSSAFFQSVPQNASASGSGVTSRSSRLCIISVPAAVDNVT